MHEGLSGGGGEGGRDGRRWEGGACGVRGVVWWVVQRDGGGDGRAEAEFGCRMNANEG